MQSALIYVQKVFDVVEVPFGPNNTLTKIENMPVELQTSQEGKVLFKYFYSNRNADPKLNDAIKSE